MQKQLEQSILMSSADRVAHIDGATPSDIMKSSLHALAEYNA